MAEEIAMLHELDALEVRRIADLRYGCQSG